MQRSNQRVSTDDFIEIVNVYALVKPILERLMDSYMEQLQLSPAAFPIVGSWAQPAAERFHGPDSSESLVSVSLGYSN